jgi:hypothetical protein
MKEQIVLPKEVRAPKRTNPGSMIIYGLPKSGKTSAAAQLENNLIIDVEKGSGFIEGKIIEPPESFGPVARFQWLRELAATIKENNYPYDFVTIDSLSKLNDDAEWVGTYNYMRSVQGSSFNRVKDKYDMPIKNGEMLKMDDPDYESVHSLGQGYGYKWSREAIKDLFDDLRGLGKICTIFICHVTDKMIARTGGGEIMTKDLALTGKVRDIISREADAIGNVWNKDGKLMISFEGKEDRIGGIRAKHLAGFTGELDWSKIFI